MAEQSASLEGRVKKRGEEKRICRKAAVVWSCRTHWTGQARGAALEARRVQREGVI